MCVLVDYLKTAFHPTKKIDYIKLILSGIEMVIFHLMLFVKGLLPMCNSILFLFEIWKPTNTDSRSIFKEAFTDR